MQTSAATPPHSTQPEVSTGSFMGAVFFALLAGLILNLMPCVLPVLSLKLLGLIKHHHGPERITQTLAYTGGIVSTFWAFAVTVFIIQRSGAQIGWGFHLQNPLFVAVLALLMLAVALNFFGVFEVGHSLTRLGAKPDKSPRHPLWQSFGTGVLAVIVATPCTVPFMGGAMAYAFTQPLPQSLAVFTALGLGLALPFLIAIPFPHVFRWLPKPGAWMLTFRHILGWPMLATALWLTFVFAAQTMQMGGLIPVYALFTFAILFSFALWFYGTRKSPTGRRLPAIAVLLTVIACIGALHTLLLPPSGTMPVQWRKWSPEAVAQATQTQPVFIDFTADWCVTCKVTEATVLNTTRVQTLFQTHNVALFKADWTLQDPAITEELARHGRKGVPLYLYYRKGEAEPQILPQLLTPGLLEATLAN
jgi:thiol:disulfide interchange protein DsbD